MRHRTTLESKCEPWTLLAIKMLEWAKRDAQRGDLAALAWLVFTGTEWAERISPGASKSLLVFCQQVTQQAEAGQITTTWDAVLKN